MLAFDPNIYKKKIEELKKSTEKSKVLIVEDHKELHDALYKFFSYLYKEVDSAYDGEEALELYNYCDSSQQYDIIFTDIEMPNKNGIELVKDIRKQSLSQNIVVFSAYKDSKYLVELINSGVKKFISKPIDFMNLVDELISMYEDINHINKINSSNQVKLSNNIFYDMGEKNIYENGQLIKLSQYESLILLLLVKNLNKAVSTEDIVSFLEYHMICINIENVRKLVYKLRRKIPNDIIESIHGVGYRIVINNKNTQGDN